jgi:hypothetical protein
MDTLKEIHQTQTQLLAAVETLTDRLGPSLAITPSQPSHESSTDATEPPEGLERHGEAQTASTDSVLRAKLDEEGGLRAPAPASSSQRSAFTPRIVLTTYPKQIGINPFPMSWGDADPQRRGPVVVSRLPSTIRRRNAIGAHGGSYSIYYALAVASKELNVDHRPDFTNTEPAVSIGPFPQWGDPDKIVAMDPYGHLAPWLFRDTIEKEDSMMVSPLKQERWH